MKYENINIQISRDELSSFLDKIKELNKISEYHRVKFSPKANIIYSKEGEHDKINQVRVYVDKNKIFRTFPDIELTWTINDGKNWHTQFSHLLDNEEEEFDFNIEYNTEDNSILSVEGKSKYLVLRAISGDSDLIKKDLTVDIIKEVMNPKNSNWKTSIKREEIDRVIKLAKLEEDDLIRVLIEDNQVYFKQTKWKLLIGEVDHPNVFTTFNKEDLTKLSKSAEVVDFCMFDTYVLIKEHNSLLLFSLELTD